MSRSALLAICFGCTAPDAVTVRVTRAWEPVRDAKVVFHDALGAWLATITTDDAGLATHEGAQVTVVDPADPLALFTITPVTPSETPIDVSLHAPYDFTPRAVASARVEAPPMPPPAGTDRYLVVTACSQVETPSLPVDVDITAGCLAESVPIGIMAMSGGIEYPPPPIAIAYAAGYATGTDLRFSPTAWTDACSHIDVLLDTRMSPPMVLPRLGGVGMPVGAVTCAEMPPAPGYALSLGVPDLGEGIVVTSGGRISSTQSMSIAQSFPEVPTTLDIGVTTPPLIGYMQLGAMDDVHVEWSTMALADADVAVAHLFYSFGGPGVTWTFVVPPSTHEITYPALPPEIATWGDLTGPTRRQAAFHYADASWVDHPSHIAFSRRLPARGELRGFTQVFTLPGW